MSPCVVGRIILTVLPGQIGGQGPPAPGGGSMSDPCPGPQGAHGEPLHAFLDAVFRTHRESLVLFALRFVETHADAEDIVQAVFLCLLERGTDAPRVDVSYLRRAVRNRSLNRRRNRTARWRGRHAWGHQQRISGYRPHTPERAMEEKRIAAVLRAGVAALSRGERDAWQWVYSRGASHGQAAERLGISPKAVKQRLWRARRHIRAYLRSLGFESMDDLIDGEGAREFGPE